MTVGTSIHDCVWSGPFCFCWYFSCLDKLSRSVVFHQPDLFLLICRLFGQVTFQVNGTEVLLHSYTWHFFVCAWLCNSVVTDMVTTETDHEMFLQDLFSRFQFLYIHASICYFLFFCFGLPKGHAGCYSPEKWWPGIEYLPPVLAVCSLFFFLILGNWRCEWRFFYLCFVFYL